MNLTEILKSETGDNEERPRYVIRNAAYALQPLQPIEYIIDKLISAGSVSLFYGESGSKKTYALLSMAVCVALGKPWLGFDVKPRKVLIVDEESGEKRLSLRLAATIRGELGDENIPLDFVSLASFKLDNKEDPKELEKLITDTGAGLVVIDALTDVMDGDENSKQDTQPVFTTLRRIAERTDAAMIIIHHSNRSGGYRGSSAIKGSLDLMVKITSDEGSEWVDFKSEKTRDVEAIKFSAVAAWTEDQFYLTPGEARATKALNKSQKYVIRYLTENGPSPMPDIMESADSCSANAARHAVYSLVDLGTVYRTNPRGNGRGAVAVYALTKEDPTNYESPDDDD
jgi:hypothetical protein